MSNLILMPGDFNPSVSKQNIATPPPELVLVQGNPSLADMDRIAQAAIRSRQNLREPMGGSKNLHR